MNTHEHVPLAWICQKVIDEASLAHPGHSIEFEPWDDAPGDWDRDLLLDLVRTLLSNALGHSAAGEHVIVSVIEFNEEAVLAIGTAARQSRTHLANTCSIRRGAGRGRAIISAWKSRRRSCARTAVGSS